MHKPNSLPIFNFHGLKNKVISIEEFLKITFFLYRHWRYENLSITLSIIKFIIILFFIYSYKLCPSYGIFPLLELVFIIFFWLLIYFLFFFIVDLVKWFCNAIRMYVLCSYPCY
jgi:hypothetical protein